MHVSPWLDRAARVGYLAKGVVYALIGWLALRLALGERGRLVGAEDTPAEVKAQPFGDVLLVVLAVGLACHALWLGITATCKQEGSHAIVRLGRRIGAAGRALMTAFLAFTTAQMVGDRSEHGRSFLHSLVRSDAGAAVVVTIGVGVIIAGLYQFYRAVTAHFEKDLETYKMSADTQRWISPIARFAHVARGIVLPVAGWLLIRAGLDQRPAGGSGTGAALRTIAAGTSSPYLLAFVAAGLIAYGVFMGVTARYGRMVA